VFWVGLLQQKGKESQHILKINNFVKRNFTEAPRFNFSVISFSNLLNTSDVLHFRSILNQPKDIVYTKSGPMYLTKSICTQL
jgi:DNA-binding beta-propeller fold protein YncE